MGRKKVYIAVDLGAESGRVVAGLFDGQSLELQELHRFPNTPLEENDGLHWDIDRLFSDIKTGIAIASGRYGNRVASIGVDTWGVDYGLLDRDGKLLGRPFHYRDRRNEGMMDKAISLLGRDAIYDATGIQFLFANTLYQLLAEKERSGSVLRRADCLLFIPDLVNYWLTGRKVNERTNASTSQFYDPRKRQWATGLLERLDLPTDILCDIADPGTRLGPLTEDIARETGAGDVEVVLPGTHDTASAVAAVPAGCGRWAFLSSGTWSLLGIETTHPVITPKSRELDLANEIGVCGTVRLLKNVAGLWLVQQCRNTWEGRGENLGYAELAEMAGSAPPFSAIIDPDHESFVQPGEMPGRISDHCEETGQCPPSSKGALVRTILESLALRYRAVLGGLEEAVGYSVETVHLVGGGARNALLNQFTANSVNREVVAGPVEATSAGNILMQLLAMGEIESLREGRDIIRRSFEMTTYRPLDTASWSAAYERFQGLL